MEIDDLNDKYPKLSLPEGEYQTLSGYLVMTAGKIPEEQGEIWEFGHCKFVIEKLSDTKIETVRVFVMDEKNENKKEIP